MVKNNYHIQLAKKFVSEHKAILGRVSDIYEHDGLPCFDAVFHVNLPSKYLKSGVTDKKVKQDETVTFVFPKSFPFVSPKIYLRDNFDRNFAHINPISEKINPCVFEGSNNELIQQPLWMDGLLDQITDWLENAASDSMINPMQGWEPIRVDDNHGFFVYDRDYIFEQCFSTTHVIPKNVMYIHSKKFGFLVRLLEENNPAHEAFKKSTVYFFASLMISNIYVPGNINNFTKLVEYARNNKIEDFKDMINDYAQHIFEEKLPYIFVSFLVTRPYHLIGSNSSIEMIHFAIEVKEHKKNKNHFHQDAGVFILGNKQVANTDLLRQFAGSQINTNITKIIQLGCGSLGSKICMHLGRNGNDNFYLIDDKFFSPNNNARHALFSNSYFFTKVELLETALRSIGLNNIRIDAKNIFDFDNLPTDKNSIIIDSTASLSVNNYLTVTHFEGSLIHTSLYNNAEIGFLGIEGIARKTKIIDFIAYMYNLCLQNNELARNITNTHASYQNVGQGCGSFTTVSTDATISLLAAGMANKIQQYIEKGLDDNGELLLGSVSSDKLSVTWQQFTCAPMIVQTIRGRSNEEWEIRIFPEVIKAIETESLKWGELETGGILIGHISIPTQTIVITSQIEAPEDSIRGKTHFHSGIKGLNKEIKHIEKTTGVMLTQLGTWHSHPNGSASPSPVDIDGKQQMYRDRNNMPTVCLIWSRHDIVAY